VSDVSELASDTVEVSFVPAELAVDMWPKVRGYIAGATERTRGRYEPEDVLYEILDQKLLLWVALKNRRVVGVATSRFLEYPRKRVLLVPFLGGDDFKSWGPDMLTLLKKWASGNDCDTLEASGRPGWSKVFGNEGYKRLWEWCEVPVDPAATGE
jgi:hypothetical protein